MKSFSATGIALLAILLLSSVSGSLMLFSNSTSSQPLSFTLSGQVWSAGTQHYVIGQSGAFTYATVDNLVLTSGNINYTLSATVSGMNVTGYAQFVLNGTMAGGTMNVSSGYVPIVGMFAAACLPNYDTPNSTTGQCLSNDTSAVPEFFIGVSNMSISLSNGTNTVLWGTEMVFESAYSNPFGNPIVIMSGDTPPSTVIITNYMSGTVDWSNVVDGGTTSGMYEGGSVTGAFSYVASEQENLVSGKANDSGTMTFYNATEGGSQLNALDVTGTYSGNSTIPTSGGTDCSAMIGFNGMGVCTETGFSSTGSYSLAGARDTIVGNYSSIWSIPAFMFNGTSSANVVPIDPPSLSPPMVDGKVTWYTPVYQGTQYIYPASVAINGVQFSATFYESLTPQYQLVQGLPYAGYYSGTFGAISGCQPGSSITIIATVNGVSQSATGTCPAAGGVLAASLVFGTPPN